MTHLGKKVVVFLRVYWRIQIFLHFCLEPALKRKHFFFCRILHRTIKRTPTSTREKKKQKKQVELLNSSDVPYSTSVQCRIRLTLYDVPDLCAIPEKSLGYLQGSGNLRAHDWMQMAGNSREMTVAKIRPQNTRSLCHTKHLPVTSVC